MSRDILDLVPEFRAKQQQVYDTCAAQGIIMVPYCTVRSVIEQAILWRQSRTKAQIDNRLAFLREQGAPFLADILDGVGPRSGPQVTGALPGESWHQWALACDSYWSVNGTAIWSPDKYLEIGSSTVNGYRAYALIAQQGGLTAGGLWKGFQDWPHTQHRKEKVTDLYTWKEINDRMKERFG
jgi:hypothetical protein